MSYSKLIADTNETIGAIETIYMADHLSRGLVDRKQQCPKQVPYPIFVMIIHIVMPFIIDTNNEWVWKSKKNGGRSKQWK